MSQKYFVLLFGAAVAAVPSSHLMGQVSPAVAQATVAAFNVPTSIQGVKTAFVPPTSFNPIEASDVELASYGFPPRPDAQAEPKAYASWARAMNASKTRVTPTLEMTNIYHGPHRNTAAAAPGAAQNSTGYSSNWSGVVDFGGATSYNHTNAFYYVVAEYVIPKAAFCANTNGWNYSSSWVGIDGYNSSDVLQTGTESDEYCTTINAQPSSTYYSAWIEWYPYASTRISSSTFPVAPGDDMFVEVWNTSATQGYAYLVDYQQNKAVTYSLTPPSGTTLKGNSAEFIVEAPTVGGGLAALTNYISDYFSNCYAYTWNGGYYTPATSTAAILSMSTNGASSGLISYPTLMGANGIWFQDTGTAR